MTTSENMPAGVNEDVRNNENQKLIGSVLSHAPQLTANWGRWLAFVTVFGVICVIGAAFRPESAFVIVGIYTVGVTTAIIAAKMKWLD